MSFIAVYIQNNIPTLVILCIIVPLILYIFFKNLINLRKETNALADDLDRAINICSEYQNNKTQMSPENFDNLNLKLTAIMSITEQWSEFTQTLVWEEDVQTGVKLHRNTIQAEDFLSSEKLIQHKINLTWHNTVPSVLTGLGLIGTFLSLLLGLHGLIDTTGKVSDIGVTHLISGLSAKFISSLTGLVFAMLYIGLEKNIYLGPLEQKCLKLQELIDRIFDRYTPEKILLKILRENKEQSIAMGQFSTDLADNIRGGINESFRPILENLVNAVNTLENKIVDAIKDAIKNVSKQTTDVLVGDTKTLSDSISQTASLLQGLQGNNEETQRKTREMLSLVEQSLNNQQEKINYQNTETSKLIETLVRNVQELTNNQQAALQTSVNSVIGKTVEVNEQIVRTAQSQTSSAAEIRAAAEKMSEVIKEFGAVIQKNKELSAGLNPVISQISQAARDLSSVGSSVRQSQEIIANTVKEFDNQVKGFANQGDIYKASMEFSKEQLEKQRQIFTETQNKLAGILNELDQGLNRYASTTQKSINTFVNDFDGLLKNAVSSLSGTINELEGTLGDLLEGFEKK